LNARYYDPKRGQFLSQDSVYLSLGSGKDKREQVALLDPQMQNSYAYARNNPIKHVDPEGDFAFLIPLIAYGIWQAAEVGLTVMDTVNAVEILQSSDATTAEKAISVVGAVAGLALPGGGYGSVVNKVDDVADGVKAIGGVKGVQTLAPGSFAQESIPARSSARNFTREEVAKVNEMENKNGCHTCGTKDPGTARGNFVKDHQPPTGLNQNNQLQKLLHQCIGCSRQQGGAVSAIKNFFKNLSK
jgi:RHS repeat-associated protein